MGYLINSSGAVESVDAFFEAHPELQHTRREVIRRYIAKNFAWPVVHPRSHRARVLVRLAQITGPALVGLMYFLADEVRGRVAVSNFVETWEHAVFGNANSAIEYIANSSDTMRRQTSVSFDDHELPATIANSRSAFSPLLELYRDKADNVFDLATFGKLDEKRQRYNVMLYNHRTETLSFDRVSSHFSIVTSDWAANAKGLRFEDQPNSAYAVHAKQGYREASRRASPIFSKVKTVVQSQLTNRPVDIEYERLLLPFRSSEDETLILCTSIDTSRRCIHGQR